MAFATDEQFQAAWKREIQTGIARCKLATENKRAVLRSVAMTADDHEAHQNETGKGKFRQSAS